MAWRPSGGPTVEAESTELGLAGLPEEGKDARDKEGAGTDGTSSQIHLGGCGRTAQSKLPGGQGEAAGFD